MTTPIKPILKITADCLEWRFIHTGGPGGQHVNKVATGAVLRVSISNVDFPAWQKRKLIKLAGAKLSDDGILTIESRDTRSQKRNREDALRKLNELLLASAIKPKRRIPTKPTKASVQRRLDKKQKRSSLKKDRQKPL